MNKGLFRKILPHLIAVLLFLVIAIIYCKPALEGQVLQQQDISQWKGAIHQSELVKEKYGKAPLWSNSMFGGMPTFQIGFETHNVVPGIVHNILTLGLPAPIQFFFLSCICFYFLCIVLRLNPYIGIVGALGFAYATYNPVIIVAGHSTKMWAMAYMPAILGSLIMIYEKKYWIGAALMALFTATMISMNHPQIAYYFFIAVAIMTIFYAVRWIKQKDYKHFGLAFVFTMAAGLTGVLVNAENLLSTYEYQKQTIRGGPSPLTDTTNKDAKSQTGLDKDYAFSYSMNITEPFVMLVPGIFGASDEYPTAVGGKGYHAINEDNSKTVEALQALPQELGNQLAGSTKLYWGGIGATTGPPYVGAIIIFLAILSLFLVQNQHRWWALTVIILTIMMSWGSFFKEFNYILYDILPFYNKFRAPSMILVIPQLLLPMLAAIGLDIYTKTADRKSLFPAFKKGLIATGAVFLFLFILYMSFDYMSESDNAILKNVRNAKEQPQLYETVRPFFDALKEDRKGLLLGNIFRSLGFIAVAVAALFLFIRNSLKPVAAIAIIGVFAFIDVIAIDARYLNADNYQDKLENENEFQLTKFDEEILADKSYYRVFNISRDRFQEAFTSYHYNSLGGYHAVKLRLYQDIIEKQLSTQQPGFGILDMLNVKYIIQKDQNGLTQQYQKNDGACGPAWLVKNIRFVKNADEEMAAITNFNPKDTAFIQESFRSQVPFMPVADSTATIQLVKNENDYLSYNFNAATNQFAVFSEVYYEPGWNALIDGKAAPIVKTNYILRGLAVPAGKHTIELKFEPPAYMKGKALTSTFNIVLVVFLLGGIMVPIAIGRRGRRNKGGPDSHREVAP
jgi:hypothetical protein